MPLVSFSGTTSQGPFWKQILVGRKKQTCRLPRKRPIKKGARLIFYWKVRVPAIKKPIHFIGEAECVDVPRVRYKEFAYDDDFARRNGFRDSAELREWFGPVDIYGETEYDVVKWEEVFPSVEAKTSNF